MKRLVSLFLCLVFFGLSNTLPASAAGVFIPNAGKQSSVMPVQLVMSPGFFTVGKAMYRVDPDNHYCTLENLEQWLNSRGPLNTADAPNYAAVPKGMLFDGTCKILEGLFWKGGMGFYADSHAHYCLMPSWEQWINSQGPANIKAVRNYTAVPSSMKFIGDCWIVDGPFKIKGTGLNSAYHGHYCRHENTQTWKDWASSIDLNLAPNYPFVPRSMVYDGICGEPLKASAEATAQYRTAGFVNPSSSSSDQNGSSESSSYMTAMVPSNTQSLPPPVPASSSYVKGMEVPALR